MSADLALVFLMGGALAFTAWMWVPPRRGSGLEPSTQTGRAELDEGPRRIEPFVDASPTFADLVTIGALDKRPSMPRLPRRLRAARALGAKPGELMQPGQMRRSIHAEITADQKRVILLAAADDVKAEAGAEEVPPMARNSEGRADELHAALYGLVRLDGGVRWVDVDDAPTDTLPPAAVEDDEP